MCNAMWQQTSNVHRNIVHLLIQMNCFKEIFHIPHHKNQFQMHRQFYMPQ